MQKLKFLYLFGSVMSLIGAATGVQYVYVTPGVIAVTNANDYSRLYALFQAIIFGAFCYGIQKRVVLAWFFSSFCGSM